MPQTMLSEMKAYIGFSGRDAKRLHRMARVIKPLIPGVVQRFYEELLKHASARAVFTGGPGQITRQRQALAGWMAELFSGVYERDYYDNRLRIGRTHVQVGLPQRYLFLGMELIRQELMSGLRGAGDPELEAGLEALNKVLALDLTIMLQSYTESYAEQARTSERAEMEEKLTRAQHLAEIGQLAASLAHEIKNPLAGISGAIQIIGDALAADNPHRAIVGEILAQINRLDAAVKDLLLYARPSPPRISIMRLDKLVSRVLALLREEPELQRVQARLLESVKDTTVHADEGQIEQLLINLILNAVHASPSGGTVEIAVEPRGERIRLVVRDYGTGMPADVLDRALEPFFTTKAKGTGLGLPICRRIVEAHGGSIVLHSEPGKGTSVTVELPRDVERRT